MTVFDLICFIAPDDFMGDAQAAQEVLRRAVRTADAVCVISHMTKADLLRYVDVDEGRRVLIVHLVDASDPVAVRARHARTHERWLRRAVP